LWPCGSNYTLQYLKLKKRKKNICSKITKKKTTTPGSVKKIN